MATTPRSRRDRPAKPALSREAIVAAALEIAAEEGVEAVTMRRLAQALDTGPASLYVYVAGREALEELMLETAAGEVEVEETDPERWREQLHSLLERMGRMMSERYPGMAKLGMARIPVGDNVMRITESMLSLLKAGGASDQAAAYAGDILSMYVGAIAYEQSLYAQPADDPEAIGAEHERIHRAFVAADPGRYPTVAALGPAMVRGDGHERFRLGIDVIINGLIATPMDGRLSEPPAALGDEEVWPPDAPKG
ncbi:MAG TPA: TetR/AcrR family transcriptional regulator C-terminal domain-containing protein [Solirubrobacteraceae bacterium]|nr:TetR/AcrR family transcriptional regulator C-terminal domain-containing protein [Solirubrobacteraceae bacterium]